MFLMLTFHGSVGGSYDHYIEACRQGLASVNRCLMFIGHGSLNVLSTAVSLAAHGELRTTTYLRNNIMPCIIDTTHIHWQWRQ